MAVDNKQIATDVLGLVGGAENVSVATNCMTRLRAHGQDLAEREVLLEPDLRRLINAEDEESEAEPGGELRGGRAGGGVRHEGFLRPPHQAKRRFSPAPKRLDAQRGQSVGCSASLPMPAT